MFEITERAEKELLRLGVKPNIVLVIDGIDEIFGAVRILKYIRIGDPGLFIDGSWRIGGLNEVAEQDDIIMLSGTTTAIAQQLRPDQGAVSSVSSLQVQLVDLDLKMTRYISPGVEIEDILARRATVYVGFRQTAYPEDYIPVFKGIIDDVDSGAGFIKFNIAHPDQKKRQQIFFKKDTNLASSIDNVVTTIPVTDASSIFLTPYTDTPTGEIDLSIKYYVRIENECIRYTGATLAGLTGCTRGQLGTAQVAHSTGSNEIKVESIYVLEDNVVDLALKTMLSGKNGNFVTGIPVESINQVDPFTFIQNTVVFRNINIAAEYGIVAGDFITISGSGIGGNNLNYVPIVSIDTINDGSYVVLDASVTLTTELDSPAVVALRSKYDTWGIGLGLDPRDVDVEEHEYWKALLLGSQSMRLYIKDDINGLDLIHKEFYAPIGAYSLPRKGKCSMGYHIGPVPRNEIPVFDKTNVREPSKLHLRRTTNRNFYNTIIYAYDELATEERFVSGVVVTNEDSKSRIPIGTKAFKSVSKGLRKDLGANATAQFVANRMLGRYKFAAEYFEKVKVFYKKGYNIEPGDIVVLDGEDLQISNTYEGDRNRPKRLVEVINKKFDLKGDIEVDLVDTNYDLSERYGLISPSTTAVSGTTTYAIIEDSYNALYPGNEKKKWVEYIGLPIIVHDENYTYEYETVLIGFDPSNRYKMLFDPPLPSPIVAGDIIDIARYPDSTDKNENDKYKAIHAYQSPNIAIVTGISNTQFTVGVSDASKFQVGFPVVVHDDDFTNASEELTVTDVTGVTITVSGDMGFTPDNTYVAEYLGFADGQFTYRYI